MERKQTSNDAALNSAGQTAPQGQTPAQGDGLYAFNFEDINLEGADGQQGQDLQQDPAPEASEEQNTEDTGKEERRREKLSRKRARHRGWDASVGFLSWVKDLVIAGLIVWLILYSAAFVTVQDSNMEPTMSAGEHILVFKLSYRFTTPARGETVAISNTASSEASEDDTGVFFARVIGLPGDTVTINPDGQIFVNDVLLETKYCSGTTGYVFGELSYPYVVPEDSYFVLSDNPSSTIDSRYGSVRAVSLDNIVGKVICCYWPKTSWRPIH